MTYTPPSAPNQIAPWFLGNAAFMQIPFAQTWEEAEIGLFGVPYDRARTHRAGTCHGLRELRNQSSLIRVVTRAARINPFELASVWDIGDIPFTRIYEVETTHDEIEACLTLLLDAGILPFAIGGDHSISLPLLRAVAKDGPVALIHIKAHAGTTDSFQGSKFNHGAPFRRAVGEGLIDPAKTIRIGIRGRRNTSDGWDFSQSSGIRRVLQTRPHHDCRGRPRPGGRRDLACGREPGPQNPASADRGPQHMGVLMTHRAK